MTVSVSSPTLSSSLRPTKTAARPSQAGRRRIMRWLKRGLLVVAALGTVAGLVYAWLPTPTTVDTAIVRRGALEVEVEEDGQTRVHDRYIVAAPISGDLQRIELEPGASVRSGEVVATILPPTAPLLDARIRRETTARMASASARREAARSAIAKAEAAHNVAVREAGRVRQLVDRSAVAAAELDRAELAAQVANRDLAAARASDDAARAEVAALSAMLEPPPPGTATSIPVTAPATGRVLRRLRDSAGPVAAGTPLLELGDLGALEVVVDVLSADAAQIAPGMSVHIERWGGSGPLAGRVLRVEPSAFTRVSALGVEEQRVRVIVALDDVPPVLGDGYRVTARIVTWNGDDVMLVPSSAVFRDRGQWAVYVVSGDRAVLKTIEIGHRGRLDLEVLRGLDVGDRVIVHPGDRVRPGARVANPAS